MVGVKVRSIEVLLDLLDDGIASALKAFSLTNN